MGNPPNIHRLSWPLSHRIKTVPFVKDIIYCSPSRLQRFLSYYELSSTSLAWSHNIENIYRPARVSVKCLCFKNYIRNSILSIVPQYPSPKSQKNHYPINQTDRQYPILNFYCFIIQNLRVLMNKRSFYYGTLLIFTQRALNGVENRLLLLYT